MRLRNMRRSSNVVDRRGGGRVAVGGGLGIVGLLAVLAIGYVTGIDVTPMLQGDPSGRSAPAALDPAEQQAGDFASRVLATTEDVWTRLFPAQAGADYTPPRLVLFSGVTQSGCGGASAASGPFYCPEDETAYLDTRFFAVLAQQLGAGGDFAAAYVIAHEIGHHVQNELGILGQVHAARARLGANESNALSVRTELQADCLAGIWATNVEGLLEPGDVEEALNAARRIGDDYLAERAGQAPNPHEFSHGTSRQRASWFDRGYRSGEIAACDTFAAKQI